MGRLDGRYVERDQFRDTREMALRGDRVGAGECLAVVGRVLERPIEFEACRVRGHHVAQDEFRADRTGRARGDHQLGLRLLDHLLEHVLYRHRRVVARHVEIRLHQQDLAAADDDRHVLGDVRRLQRRRRLREAADILCIPLVGVLVPSAGGAFWRHRPHTGSHGGSHRVGLRRGPGEDHEVGLGKLGARSLEREGLVDRWRQARRPGDRRDRVVRQQRYALAKRIGCILVERIVVDDLRHVWIDFDLGVGKRTGGRDHHQILRHRPPNRVIREAVIERVVDRLRVGKVSGRLLQCGQRQAGHELSVIARAHHRETRVQAAGDLRRRVLVVVVPGLDILDRMAGERRELDRRDHGANLARTLLHDGERIGLLEIHRPAVDARSLPCQFDRRGALAEELAELGQFGHIRIARALRQALQRLHDALHQRQAKQIGRMDVHCVGVVGARKIAQAGLFRRLPAGLRDEDRQQQGDVGAEAWPHVQHAVDVGRRLIHPVVPEQGLPTVLRIGKHRVNLLAKLLHKSMVGVDHVVAAGFVRQAGEEQRMVGEGRGQADDTDRPAGEGFDHVARDRERPAGRRRLKNREGRQRFAELDLQVCALAPVQE